MFEIALSTLIVFGAIPLSLWSLNHPTKVSK